MAKAERESPFALPVCIDHLQRTLRRSLRLLRLHKPGAIQPSLPCAQKLHAKATRWHTNIRRLWRLRLSSFRSSSSLYANSRSGNIFLRSNGVRWNPFPRSCRNAKKQRPSTTFFRRRSPRESDFCAFTLASSFCDWTRIKFYNNGRLW